MDCQATVRLSSGGSSFGEGHVRDVSASGAFIETSLKLAVNARVALVVLGNTSATRAVEINANVVRVEALGLGVEWCDTPAGSICDTLGCRTRCPLLGGGR
jgi:hypothetical protein